MAGRLFSEVIRQGVSVNRLNHSLFNHNSVRCMAIFAPKVKPGETEPGVKTKDLVRVKEFLHEKGIENNYDSKNFQNTIEDFHNIKRIKRFGYAEFVAAALPAMADFGVEKDLESYKSLMRIFPSGAFIPTSKFASGFFPNFIQQKAACNILNKMEVNRVMPDKEMETLIIEAFSTFSEVWKKCARMTYWMTKIKNANPFPFPEEIPKDPLELALIALKRMSIDPQSDASVYSTTQIENTNEDTWICFVQSDCQRRLIEELNPEKCRVSVDGPFQVWVENHSVSYFVLFARDVLPSANKKDLVEEFLDAEHDNNDVSNIPLSNFGHTKKEEMIDPMRKVHIQDDGTILAVAATGTSSQDSLITWIRMLEKENPRLRLIPVIISNQIDIKSTLNANTSNQTNDINSNNIDLNSK